MGIEERMGNVVIYAKEGERIERKACSSNLEESTPNNYANLNSFLEDIRRKSGLELYLFNFTPEEIRMVKATNPNLKLAGKFKKFNIGYRMYIGEIAAIARGMRDTPEDEPDSFTDKLFYRVIGMILLPWVLCAYLKRKKD